MALPEEFTPEAIEAASKDAFAPYRTFHDSGEPYRSMLRLGDAGAHVSQIMDADWSTFILAYWVRARGRFSLAEGIRRMTSAPARVLGRADRGRLAEGLRADITVFDPDRVVQLRPEIAHDFPGGAPRYAQRARGYRATLVNGEINLLDDALTGTRAGQVVRQRA